MNPRPRQTSDLGLRSGGSGAHAHTVCPGLCTKIRRLIWPCSADDDAAARRPGCCCCRGAALRLAGRAAGPHACRAWLGGSRVAGGCGKPVRRCGGGKSPATEGALSEDPQATTTLGGGQPRNATSFFLWASLFSEPMSACSAALALGGGGIVRRIASPQAPALSSALGGSLVRLSS